MYAYTKATGAIVHIGRPLTKRYRGRQTRCRYKFDGRMRKAFHYISSDICQYGNEADAQGHVSARGGEGCVCVRVCVCVCARLGVFRGRVNKEIKQKNDDIRNEPNQ